MDEGILEDLRVMGADEETIAAWKKAQAPDPELLLMPDVFDSVRVFDAMATQWDRAGERGHRAGFKYNRLPIFLQMMKIPRARRSQIFSDIRVLEQETLLIDGERREANA